MIETLQDIADRLCFAMREIYPDFNVSEATGTGRSERALVFRTAFVVECRRAKATASHPWSFPEIAAALGRRNHSTVLTIWHDYLDSRRNLDTCDIVERVLSLAKKPARLHPDLGGSPDAQRHLLSSLGIKPREVA